MVQERLSDGEVTSGRLTAAIYSTPPSQLETILSLPFPTNFSYSNIHTHLPLERSSLTFLILPELYKLNSSTSLSLQCILYSATVCLCMLPSSCGEIQKHFTQVFLADFLHCVCRGEMYRKIRGMTLPQLLLGVCVYWVTGTDGPGLF